jgi:hypothetical protein
MKRVTRTFLAGLVVSSLLAIGWDLRADPLQHPQRTIDGRSVDLSPLFKWWDKHKGERPLTGWVHVAGTIVGTNFLGWTVEGRFASGQAGRKTGLAQGAAGDAEARIVLAHPPVSDLDQCAKLRAERAELSARAAEADRQAQEIEARLRGYRHTRVRTRGLAQEAKVWREKAKEARAGRDAIDGQLRQLSVSAPSTPTGKYSVDCFALKTARQYDGIPVYDHGAVLR